MLESGAHDVNNPYADNNEARTPIQGDTTPALSNQQLKFVATSYFFATLLQLRTKSRSSLGNLLEPIRLGIVPGVLAFQMQHVQHTLQLTLQQRGEGDAVTVDPFAALDGLLGEVLGLDLLEVEAEGAADGG